MTIKRLMRFVVVTGLVVLMAANAYAASKTVNIVVGSGPVQSGAITANNGAKYEGTNSADSGHRLYIDLQASAGSGWANMKTSLMDIGQSAKGFSEEPGDLLWRVQLNPQYYYSDCKGSGTVSNR